MRTCKLPFALSRCAGGAHAQGNSRSDPPHQAVGRLCPPHSLPTIPGRCRWRPNLTTVENLKKIKPGEGLQASLTGDRAISSSMCPIRFRSRSESCSSPRAREGKPVMFGIRLKGMPAGKIVEAEHLVGNALNDAQIANLQKPRAGLLRTCRPTMRICAGG